MHSPPSPPSVYEPPQTLKTLSIIGVGLLVGGLALTGFEWLLFRLDELVGFEWLALIVGLSVLVGVLWAIPHGPSLPNGRLNEAWWISGILICSFLGVFVVPPVGARLSAMLSETTQTIGYFAGFAATIWVIGWGSTLGMPRRRTKP